MTADKRVGGLYRFKRKACFGCGRAYRWPVTVLDSRF